MFGKNLSRTSPHGICRRLTVERLEDRSVPAVVTISDNGNLGFYAVGSWTNSTTQGYLGDIHTSTPGVGSDKAGWSLSVPDAVYRISVNWTTAPDRASNVRYKVSHSLSTLGTVVKSQQVAPNDFTDGTTAWEVLGSYVIRGGRVVVELTDEANGTVAADGIRIERLSPAVSLQTEPFENGAVVYEALAPEVAGGQPRGLLALRLRITNTDNVPAKISRILVSFTGSTSTLGRGYYPDLTIPANTSVIWSFRNDHGIDDRLTLLTPFPTGMQVEIRVQGIASPKTFVYPIKPHVSPVDKGAYLFPSQASDLRVGEYWSGSTNHATGNQGSQLFGYDLDVQSNETNNQKSYLLPGTTGTKNEDYRIWGKPIRAMAAGKVVGVQWNVPSNAGPLSWTSQTDLDQKLADQKRKYWGTFIQGDAGNHLYIQHGDEVVLYAHLQRNSIPLALRTVGATVTPGVLLGLAGNSGNSTAPHLHIHAIQGTQPEIGPLRPFAFRDIHLVRKSALTPGTPNAPWVKANKQVLPRVETLIWPAATAPTWYPPGYAYLSRHGISRENFQAEFDRLVSSGYRPTWIDGYNVGSQTYFNIIVKPQVGVETVARHDLTTAQYQSEFTLRSSQGYRLIQVDSYLVNGSVRYAGIWVKQPGPAWVAYHAKPTAQHQVQFNLLSAQGYHPVNVSVVVVNGVAQVTALYVKENVAPFVLRIGMTAAQYQAEVTGNAAAGRKLVYVNGYREAGVAKFSAIWQKKLIAPFVIARHDLTSSRYQAEIKLQADAGFELVVVTGYEVNGQARFAAIWKK